MMEDDAREVVVTASDTRDTSMISRSRRVVEAIWREHVNGRISWDTTVSKHILIGHTPDMTGPRLHIQKREHNDSFTITFFDSACNPSSNGVSWTPVYDDDVLRRLFYEGMATVAFQSENGLSAWERHLGI